MKTIHKITWRTGNGSIKPLLNFDIEEVDCNVSSVNHPIANWSVGERWDKVYNWFIKKGAKIESFQQGPHEDYEVFREHFKVHVFGEYDEEYIKGAYVFYIGQSKIKKLSHFLDGKNYSDGFIKGHRGSGAKIYYVPVVMDSL